jgi:hypothetical protein
MEDNQKKYQTMHRTDNINNTIEDKEINSPKKNSKYL